jgi:hypothetical protein
MGSRPRTAGAIRIHISLFSCMVLRTVAIVNAARTAIIDAMRKLRAMRRITGGPCIHRVGSRMTRMIIVDARFVHPPAAPPTGLPR